MVFNIMDGLKSYHELGMSLTAKDLHKVPQCPRLQIKHVEMAKILMDTFDKNELVCEVDNNVSCIFSPIIQSNGFYNLDLKSGTDENYFNDDVVIICLGIKYKQYCSTVIRTIIVTPTKNNKLKNNYKLLLRLQKFIIVKLRDGVELCKIYKAGVNFVMSKRPDLLKHLSDNFGLLIGKEPKSVTVITANSDKVAEENMIFSVNVGFHGLYDAYLIERPPHTYSLWIGDSVKVEKGRRATLLKYIASKADHTILRRKRVVKFENKTIDV